VRPDGRASDPTATAGSRRKSVDSPEAAVTVGTAAKADDSAATEAADDTTAAVGAACTTTTATESTAKLSFDAKEPDDQSESTPELADASPTNYGCSSNFSNASPKSDGPIIKSESNT